MHLIYFGMHAPQIQANLQAKASSVSNRWARLNGPIQMRGFPENLRYGSANTPYWWPGHFLRSLMAARLS
jgi:hypothetical protein